MVPQTQAAAAKAHASHAPEVSDFRATQKRWPMAFSILGAVAASLTLWAVIFWLIGLVLGAAG